MTKRESFVGVLGLGLMGILGSSVAEAAVLPMNGTKATTVAGTLSWTQLRVSYEFNTQVGDADSKGYIYLAGSQIQPVVLNGGASQGIDSAIAKIDPHTGATIWKTAIDFSDSGNSDYVTQVVARSNAVYVLVSANEGPVPTGDGTVISQGSYHMTSKVVKLNPNDGSVIWAQAITDWVLTNTGQVKASNVFPANIEVAEDGRVAFLGQTGTYNSPTSNMMLGDHQWMVTLVHADGSLGWMKRISGDYRDCGYGPARNLPVGARFFGDKLVVAGVLEQWATMLDFAVATFDLTTGSTLSQTLWSDINGHHTDSLSALTWTDQGFVAAVGAYGPLGKYGALLVRWNLADPTQIAQLNFFRSPGTYSKFKRVRLAPNGDIYLAGTTDPVTTWGAIDPFVNRYTSDGTLVSSQTFPGAANGIDYGNDFSLDCLGRGYLTTNNQAANGEYDLGLTRIGATGTHVKSVGYDGIYHADDFVYFTLETREALFVFAKGGEYSPSPTTPYLMRVNWPTCAGPGLDPTASTPTGVGAQAN